MKTINDIKDLERQVDAAICNVNQSSFALDLTDGGSTVTISASFFLDLLAAAKVLDKLGSGKFINQYAALDLCDFSGDDQVKQRIKNYDACAVPALFPRMKPIDFKSGDHMPLDEFLESVEVGAFIPYDGSGYYATATHESRNSVWDRISPPSWATHVMWYNK